MHCCAIRWRIMRFTPRWLARLVLLSVFSTSALFMCRSSCWPPTLNASIRPAAGGVQFLPPPVNQSGLHNGRESAVETQTGELIQRFTSWRSNRQVRSPSARATAACGCWFPLVPPERCWPFRRYNEPGPHNGSCSPIRCHTSLSA
jgi:hypothetical protein